MDNVSVITELDDLVRKSANAQQRYDRRASALNILKENIHEEKKMMGAEKFLPTMWNSIPCLRC